MKHAFGEWVQWKRVEEYLDRYSPRVIGVVGTSHAHLAVQAIGLAVRDHLRIRVSDEYITSSEQVAQALLGMSRAGHMRSWWRSLVGSAAKELAEEEPQAIAVEIPSHQPGQVDTVAGKLPLHMGVVTDVGSVNLGLYGSKEMVAHEQLSVLASLPADGAAILNADDPLIARMAEHTKARIVTFGYDPHATIHFRRVKHLAAKGLAAEVVIDGRAYEIGLPHIIGQHQIVAIGAALAVAYALRIPTASAVADVRKTKPAAGHVVVLEGIHESLLLDNSFDATWEDTVAAVDTLGQLSIPGRRIAILGDIADAGSMRARAYEDIGRKVQENAHVFVAVGQEMSAAQTVALKIGDIDTHHFRDSRDVGKWLTEYIRPGDCVLVKGSKAMNMQEVVARLRKE